MNLKIVYYFTLNFLTVVIHAQKTKLDKISQVVDTWKAYSKGSSRWTNFSSRYYENHSEKNHILSTPEECARPCKLFGRPKTCHFKWTVEYYHTFGSACNYCQPISNTSVSSNCQCILADGFDVSGIVTVNRMYPGPAIQVCLGDFVVVDVTNKVPGNGLTIHWHGIYQKDWQHYDGVPFLTQCPISEGSTFRYQWRAQNPGSHFWHAHSGFHKGEGLHGLIAIREPKVYDPNAKLYDFDNPDNVIFISDWMHGSVKGHIPGTTVHNPGQVPDNILINGKGQFMDAYGRETLTPLAVFNVKSGKRYRFRLINGGSFNCPVKFTIQNHDVTLISLDGEHIEPRTVTTITSFSAERVDFVLNAYQAVGTYWIQVRGFGVCADRGIQQSAVLRYVGSPLEIPATYKPFYNLPLDQGIVFNEISEVCDGTTTNKICLKDLTAIEDLQPSIVTRKSDIKLYLPFNFHLYNDTDLFKPNTYKRFLAPDGGDNFGALIGGISNVSPSSPFISQLDEIPKEQICNQTHLPARCLKSNNSICHCSHVINIPLNSVVDLIIVDASGPTGISHPFHLHGFGFHVLAQGLLSKVNLTEDNVEQAIELDGQVYGLSHSKPITKDTIAVPSEGYVIVRFVADNPGWWLFHCHFLPHLYNGMSLVIRIGEQEDLPHTPKGFPKCGNFMPNFYKKNPKSRRNT
ncbi:Similar to LCC4: Laccase-4 (Trametes versicolor) [Cotesia congregata]|uniref:Similar to LCC4: Laccase-4 (Trametes versicolor) n=1 Tax=Cotesia congregata TaxID=51543 RepID=A0A8J2HR04_COTCN|nr:Similar to LCC4: Laccase-4 (Trametes versicolor) [Cotesia congregata]